ncbi:acyltransferase family protein [Jiella marina]|uniref:acyltransferase family protein n=1 Tax=Jiella sp. LLJ827 TaxID=2917712 RepID=UPI0021019BE3|nr:acyltransferase family protein [Jiella sp. LLJ827]MCQ0987389.1 acyltransferase [Jiella sp. LLJ827]
MRYRPEIDGLRAIAVLPVIFFHAGFSTFGGGYVGVDVFFVISGFLITTILLNDLAADRFSLARFYERRARRILPALFLVTALSAVAAAVWMMPSQLESFSKSLVAVATFWSNVHFWKESGYFATAAELKPLLHTWSLAVEEQYYILFPVFLWMMWRFARRWLLSALVLLFVASLATSVWTTYAYPSFAFFWLPARSWELGIGVFAALYLQNRPAPGSLPLRQLLSLAGLGLIAFSIFWFDRETPFPGLNALVPTVGAALIILCATTGTICHRILAASPLVGVGLISYSAYLWHQPLFAFARLRAETHLSAGIMAGLCVATITLAWLSWRFVERPFRQSDTIGRRTIAGLASAGALLLIVGGVSGDETGGFRHAIINYRLSDEEQERYRLISQSTDVTLDNLMVDDGACRIWVPSTAELDMGRFDRCHERFGPPIVVLGDSHAMNLYNIVSKTEEAPFVLGVAQGGCRPHTPRPQCHYDAFDDFLQRRAPQLGPIIFHQSGSYFVADENGDVDSQQSFDTGRYEFRPGHITSVADYLADIGGAHGIEIVWLGPFVEYRHVPFQAVFDARYLTVNSTSFRIFSKLEPLIQSVVGSYRDVEYVPFSEVFVLPRDAIRQDCFLFHDKDHFSDCGESYLARSPGIRGFVADLVHREVPAKNPEAPL